MSAQHAEFGDDFMDVADAFGVTRTPHPETLRNYRPDPMVRVQLSDAALASTVEAWAADQVLDDEPIALLPDACPMCHDTGLWSTTSAISGYPITVTCPVCPPDDGRSDR